MKPNQTAPAALSILENSRLLGPSVKKAISFLFRGDTLRQWPRLWQEGIDPIVHLLLQANNTAVINQWLDRGATVAFISSFPRSGNTWMRYMLSDILLQLHQVETTTKLPVDPDDLIPAFCYNSITSRLGRCPRWAFESELSFVKTHASFARLQQIVSGAGQRFSRTAKGQDFGGARVLYLFRAPEDALVSLYHLKVCDTYSRSRARHTLDEFCRTEAGAWIHNITSYIRAADDGHPLFFISYERLLEKPGTVLTDLLNWLDVSYDSQIVPRAVSNMRFCNLQAMEKQVKIDPHPANENALFFRRGCSGSGQSELKESTLKEIRDRTATLLTDANRRQMNQFSPLPSPPVFAEVPRISPLPHLQQA